MGPSEVGLNLPLGSHSWAGTDLHFLQADRGDPLHEHLLSPFRDLFFFVVAPIIPVLRAVNLPPSPFSATNVPLTPELALAPQSGISMVGPRSCRESGSMLE